MQTSNTRGLTDGMATLQSIAGHLEAIEATATALGVALTSASGDVQDRAQRCAEVARTLRDFVSPQLRTQRDQLLRFIAANSAVK